MPPAAGPRQADLSWGWRDGRLAGSRLSTHLDALCDHRAIEIGISFVRDVDVEG